MAIQVDVTFNGLSVPKAYIEVIAPSISSTGDTLSFYVSRKVDSTYEAFQVNQVSCAYASGDAFAQAYAYLKTLPEFASAVDAT